MKNRRILKHILEPILTLIISLLISGFILFFLKEITNYFYKKPDAFAIHELVSMLYNLKRNFLGNYIYIIILLPLNIAIYILLSYKKVEKFIEVLESTEEMANGNLEKVIEVNDSGDIGKLANNINEIVIKLKEITIEEKRAQQTKTDLITNISHDLRTPLTSILGYLGLIEDDKYRNEVELRYYITIAYEKAKSLKLLINDLFEFTKLQNSSIRLEKIEIDLVELLGQIVYNFQYEFNNVHMESRVNFSEDKLIIEGDARQIVRAFENLITNAIKYGSEGKYIDLVTKSENNMAVVQVINYGDEISSLDLPYIFERFYRVEKSRNRDSGGSGLGLAITKNIIELHHGDIKAYSDSGKTVFEVKIPLK